MTPKQLLAFVKRHLKEHQTERDPEGDFACCVVQHSITRVAPKDRWLGDEKSRQEALKWQREMDKHLKCDYCELCRELIDKLKR